MTIKEEICKASQQLLASRIEHLKLKAADLFNSAANETKSTAGDKHETALALLQIEQENTRQQLRVLEEQQVLLEKIDPQIHTNEVRFGTVVQTTKGIYFISCALGKVVFENISFTAISLQSPLGMALAGKKKGADISINGNLHEIIAIDMINF
ncbi:MAG: 3-oxoacyl-ACP synthase [Ferruginibacter sp.]|nr:3-oxoacyl-ACP synthase [Ferruginibacter sp.]